MNHDRRAVVREFLKKYRSNYGFDDDMMRYIDEAIDAKCLAMLDRVAAEIIGKVPATQRKRLEALRAEIAGKGDTHA